MADSFILSIGTSVPVHQILQQDHHSILDSANGLNRNERLLLKTIYRKSGIRTRHSVLAEFGLPEEETNSVFFPATGFKGISVAGRMKIFNHFAPELAKEAVEKCFAKTIDIKYADVTHLISFSCTGMSAPGIDIHLIEALGLSRSVERTCVNFMGCYAAINAIKLASHIISAEQAAVVLLVGVELCTLHYNPGKDQDRWVANAIFSDGAAAVLLSGKSSTDSVKLQTGKFHSEFHPSGIEEMTWNINDSGFDLHLSSYVPNLVRSEIAAFAKTLMEKYKLDFSAIEHFAIHPGGVKILEACEKALGISRNQNQVSYEVLEEFGNMSSVTILFVLEKIMNNVTCENNGENIFSCAFGPGLTMESMILTLAV